MPEIIWEHDVKHCTFNEQGSDGDCAEDTSCEAFPTLYDRKRHTQLAYRAYAASDGTPFTDFLRDVIILALDGRYGMTLGEIHEEVTKAYMLSKNIEVPAELPL